MRDRRTEAAAYLGHPMPPGNTGPALVDLWPEAVIEAVTSDDLGTVPPELAMSPEWERMSDGDRVAILRFRSFLAAAGEPPWGLLPPED